MRQTNILLHTGIGSMHRMLVIFILLQGLTAEHALADEFLPLASEQEVPRLLQATAWVRGLPEAELMELVPKQSGLRYVGCPNCTGGRQENQLAWSPEHPEEIYCRYCKHRFPSEKYPMSAVVAVRNPRGEQVEFPYWADPSGYRYFFGARRDDEVREYLATQTEALARLAIVTNDEAVARRAAVLLDRFAEVFPGWCYHYDYPHRQKQIYDGVVPPEEFRSGYRTARWTWWAYSDIPSPLVRAYGRLQDHPVFEQLSRERGVDVKARIEQDLFRAAAEQVLANPETFTNMSPRAWSALVELGRVIGEPQFVHEPVRRFRHFVESQFFYDGTWSEGSPDYAAQTLGGLESIVQLLKGYSDPPGYTDPQDGSRFDDLELAHSFPLMQQARLALQKMHLPNGRAVPVHDTWSTSQRKATDRSEAYLLPALGHACIGGGEGSQQTQFHLTWSGGYGHAHADSLSLLLFSNGQELLSDLGYTHTAYRAWTLATAAHNTVVIDGQNQALGSRKAPTDGSLLGFDARSDRVQMVSADGIRGYPGLAKTYRRTLIVVEANHQQRYAIDHFEVSGGQTHDYFLHGDADVETCVSTQLELRPMESLLPKGLDWTATRNEGEAHRIAEPNYAYGFLRELHAATVPINEAIPVSFRATIGKGPGLRVSIMPEDGSQLITGVNPAIRPAGEDDSKLDQFNRPFILLRREAKDRTSNFISVIEPYEEEPFLTSVERISLPDGAIAVRVAIGDRTDIIVIGAQTGVTIPAGQNFVRFRGDYGVMSLRGEAIEHAFSLGEGGWTSENFRLASTGLRSMPLQAMESGKLVLAATSLPAPEKNDVVRVVTSDGWVYPYTLVAAETRGDQLWLTVGEGPGFQFDAQKQHMQFASFPQREHSGAVRVEWTTRAER